MPTDHSISDSSISIGRSFSIRRARRGASFYELLIALVLLASVMAGVAQCTVQAGRVARETGRRERAMEIANQVLEKMSLIGWDELESEAALAVDSDAALGADERGVDEFTISIAVRKLEVDMRQITATVSWENDQGDSRDIALHAWRHQLGDGGSP